MINFMNFISVKVNVEYLRQTAVWINSRLEPCEGRPVSIITSHLFSIFSIPCYIETIVSFFNKMQHFHSIIHVTVAKLSPSFS